MKEGLLEGMKEGMQEGMQQGVQYGIRSSIFELLKNRFDLLDGVEEIIDSITDIDELQRIFSNRSQDDNYHPF